MAAEEEDQVDILHPLATLHWEQCPSLPVSISDAQCVFVNNRLYVGSGQKLSFGTEHFNPRIFVFSTNLDLLSELTTPTYHYALTTYNSQLVLVGGRLSSTNKLSDRLWIRNERNGIWDPSLLPPMPTARSYSSAIINVGNRECIVVAGGRGETGPVNVVEALIEGQWRTLHHLPEPCWNMTSTLHNGKWYLNSGKEYILCCNLESLISSSYVGSVWSIIDCNTYYRSIASFGQQLIAIGRSRLVPTIHTLSPFTQDSWVHVGDMPEELFYSSTIVLPTRELVVIGERSKIGGSCVFKASLTMSPYHPDSHFSMNALDRLEATGIKIVTSLYGLHTKLVDILGVDKSWSVSYVINKWMSGRSHRPSTWRTLLDILKKLDLVELSQQIEDYLSGDNYLDAYQRILSTRDSLEMLFVKIIFLGPPRLGKTTAHRRLKGEIADISSAAEPEQPSTGAVESGGNVVVRNSTAVITPSEWSVLKDLTEEAHMLLQFIYSHNLELNQTHVPSDKGSSKEIHTEVSSEKIHIHSDKIVEKVSNAQIRSDEDTLSVKTVSHPQMTSDEDSTSSSLKDQRGSDKPRGFTKIPKLFRNAVNPKFWKDIKRLFKDSALLKMEDTGGQPEFMDMLPALTIGPALYLLFCKLIDDLLSRYTVSYLSPSSGEFTTPVESSYTVEEVLLTALASVSCFSSYSAISEASVEEGHSSEVREILTSSFKSVAYIVGTHKDLVSEEQIEAFDQQLQHSIRSTDFFREDLVQFSSEKRMILAIDNMNGGAKEIKKVRKFLERGIHRHFKKLRIPASWLVFSLCLRGRTERIASLDDCHQLARQFHMPSKETMIALWFLHHYAGVLMYFPDLPELKYTVICDTQIIYDSVTNLIINTFKFGSVSKCASERFRETGQFSLEDIRGATSNISGDYIPLNQLVKLLEHLNIIAPIVQDNSHPSQTKPIQSSKVTYFMPCVLQNASCEELNIYSCYNPYLPASLMIRYKCGFVPLGIFPAIIAHLVGHSPLKLIEDNIKKNCVQFQYGRDRDTVTLIYRTKYFEIHIKREHTIVTQTHEVCLAVQKIIESTLNAVSSRMNYVFSLHYQLSFKCPSHPGEDHLCVVDSTESIPRKMGCLKNAKNPQQVDMQSQHLVWFGKPLTCSEGCTSGSNLQPEGALDYQAYMSSLSPHVHSLLEKQLDWDNGGVDLDLNKTADHMSDWEYKLSAHLGLTHIDISDIKFIHLNQPSLQRREALKRWKNKRGFHATYGNLLKLFVEAGHTECVQVFCNILRKKGGSLSLVNIKTFLNKEDFPANKAGELGIYLGIKHGRISTLESDNHGNADKMLSAILSEWLNNHGEKSWKKLADALKYLGHSSTADRIEGEKTIPLGGLSRTRDAPSPDSDAPKPKLSPAAESADVREFSEDLKVSIDICCLSMSPKETVTSLKKVIFQVSVFWAYQYNTGRAVEYLCLE